MRKNLEREVKMRVLKEGELKKLGFKIGAIVMFRIDDKDRILYVRSLIFKKD